MSSCDTHRPVDVYPSSCHFSALICLSLSGSFRQCFLISIHLSEIAHLFQPCSGPSHHDADMNARQMLGYAHVCVVMKGEGGSPVTKLADEACDLFKGTPDSQHQNELDTR